jgi:ribosome-binding ATPase YchF (GTP1/OBG family)
VKRGSLAPKAAGVIHTEFAKGFIKAEVYSFKNAKELGTLSGGSEFVTKRGMNELVIPFNFAVKSCTSECTS